MLFHDNFGLSRKPLLCEFNDARPIEASVVCGCALETLFGIEVQWIADMNFEQFGNVQLPLTDFSNYRWRLTAVVLYVANKVQRYAQPGRTVEQQSTSRNYRNDFSNSPLTVTALVYGRTKLNIGISL